MGIEVNQLRFSYGERAILNNIIFDVRDGSFLSILGPNGVGKSTLLRCILGLLKGYQGTVLINGKDASSLSARELAQQIAYIPQHSAPAFRLSVEEMVLLGATSRMRPFAVPGKKERERAQWALEKLGIADLSGRSFLQLSGGERQLVIIARALVQDAGILMLDEPTASLDYAHQIQVLEQARALVQEGYTVIQTTHDPETAFLFSDRILAIRDGRVLVNGTPREVLTGEYMSKLYGMDITVSSLHDDRLRICFPSDILKQKQGTIPFMGNLEIQAP